MYLRELRLSYRARRVVGRRLPLERLTSPRESALAFQRLLRDEPVEVCGLLCVATRHQVLGYHELSRGTLDASLLQPRVICTVALLANAAGVVLGHNHPSGDPEPSTADVHATERAKAAAAIVGIEIIDHIVVGRTGYVSFKERGLL